MIGYCGKILDLSINKFCFLRSQLEGWGEKIIKERNMEVIPFTVLINPTLAVLDNTKVLYSINKPYTNCTG